MGVAEWLLPFGSKQEVTSLSAGDTESDDGELKYLSSNYGVKLDMRHVNVTVN